MPTEWADLAASPHDPGMWEEDGTVLGQGAFGVVVRGINQVTGELVAIKRIAPTDLLAISTATNEVQAARVLGAHPNVVQMKAHFLAPAPRDASGPRRDMVLIYRLALGGDLKDWIAKEHGSGFTAIDYAKPKLTDESLRIMVQLVVGLQHVHGKGVQHRDLKPANILLSAGGTALIADFGIALVNRTSSRGVVRSAPLGDFYFMDVESLVKKELPYTLDDDIYSLGEVFVRILYGNYGTGRELRQFAAQHEGRTGEKPPSVTRILAAMMEPRETRCSLDELRARLEGLRFLPQALPSQPRAIFTTAFLGIGALITAATFATLQRKKSLQRSRSVFETKSRMLAGFRVSRTQGTRVYMEDYYCHSRVIFRTSPKARSWRLLGVFDGHGGKDCAKFAAQYLPHEVRRMLRCAEERYTNASMNEPSADDLRIVAQALQSALESLDYLFVKFKKSIPGGSTRGFGYAGSTATAALLSPDGRHAVLCNIGDSRAALAGGWHVMEHFGSAPEVSADGSVVVTHPHTPGDPAEIERIEKAGGFVELGGRGYRVNGALGVSRAIGYAGVPAFSNVVFAKSDYVIAKRSTEGAKAGCPALVVLASDGVFETVGQEAAVEVIGSLAEAEDVVALGQKMEAALDHAGGGPGQAAQNNDNATLLTCLLPKIA